MDGKKGFLLRTTRAMNTGTTVSGIGFLLYLAAAALVSSALADGLAVVFALIALYVFASVAAGRKQDKEAVSYSLLWGQAALTLLLVTCAVLGIKEHLGL